MGGPYVRKNTDLVPGSVAPQACGTCGGGAPRSWTKARSVSSCSDLEPGFRGHEFLRGTITLIFRVLIRLPGYAPTGACPDRRALGFHGSLCLSMQGSWYAYWHEIFDAGHRISDSAMLSLTACR